MMRAEYVPFEGFDGLRSKDARDFLKRDTELTYIEYLISTKKIDLEQFQQLLTQYVTLIPADDPLHAFALEKFTRCVCIYILGSATLAELSKVKATLDTYFPFYLGTSYKPEWLASYAEKNKMPDMIQHLFMRDSIRIRIGQCVATSGVLSNLDLPAIKNAIVAMADDPFFSTHQQRVLGAINTVTATAGWAMRQVPVLSHINSFTNKLAQAAGQPLEVRTGRKYKLLAFAERISGILSDDLRHITQEQKLVHMELLSILFENANPTLQDDIANKANAIILLEKNNSELLQHFLKNIAPAPLGLKCYGMRSNADMLSQLSVEANNLLLRASTIRTDSTMTGSIAINFDTHDENTMWLAYFACMGKFNSVTEVRMTCGTPTHPQTQLLLYLMGSPKLVIDAVDPVSIAKLSTLTAFTPQCSFDISKIDKAEQANTATEVTRHALAYGRRATSIRITDPDDKTVEQIMKDTDCFRTIDPEDKTAEQIMKHTDCFTKIHPCAAVNYALSFTQSIECRCVEFELSGTKIKPYGNTTKSIPAQEKLLGYILDFFSANWAQKLIVTDKYDCVKIRPIAVPANELHKVKDMIERHQHLQLFVYSAPDEGKHFLYDIHRLPLEIPVSKPGPFTTTAAALEIAVNDFPLLQMPGSLGCTLLLSQTASTPTSSSAIIKVSPN